MTPAKPSINWISIVLTALCQTLFLLVFLRIAFVAPSITNWANALWTQEAAGWAAAVATLIAVIVALDSTRRAEAIALRIRHDEREEAELIRNRKEKALSAAIADEIGEALRALGLEIDRLEKSPPSRDVVQRALTKLGSLEAPFILLAMNHLDAFNHDLATGIAITAARLRRERYIMTRWKDGIESNPSAKAWRRFNRVLQKVYNRHFDLYLQVCKQGNIKVNAKYCRYPDQDIDEKVIE